MDILKNETSENDINSKYPTTYFSTFCFEWLESIIQAIIFVVIFMVFFFRIVNVSGISMLNTLHNADKVVVFKLNYIPKSGDVVVIKRGRYLDEPLIKRVIATEGQELDIDFSEGSVFVNGKKLEENYIKEPMYLQGDWNFRGKIPKGYSFVMGDNRNHSLDSRFKTVGLIENKNIIGKACFVIFPVDRIGKIR